MKKVKRILLTAGVLGSVLINAQEKSMKNMLKVGANVGFAVPSNNVSSTIGLGVAYQYLINPNFGFGIASGYNHYSGKDKNGYQNNSVGLVPLAALFRIYPNKTGFYLGADLGYGFITGDKKVAENNAIERPSGGIYLRPELGYHNKDWNFFLQYQKVFTGDTGKLPNQDYSLGSIGLGFSYNIALGE